MTQVVSFDSKIAKDILTTLRELKKEVVRLNEKLAAAPPYGSAQWWVLSEKRADEDIAAGRIVSFNSVKEAVKWLNS